MNYLSEDQGRPSGHDHWLDPDRLTEMEEKKKEGIK